MSERGAGTSERGAGRARGIALALAGLGLAAGCLRIDWFACDDDAQCVLDGRAGICAEPGYCALPDDGCTSGYRFHARSVPDELAGQCAPAPAGPGTSTGAGPASTGEASTTATGTGGGASSSSGTAASSSDGGQSSTGSECGDHPCPCTADVALGANHTCVARTDGDVTCWGANNQGQMGTGTASGPTPDLHAVALPGEAQADAILSGGEHACVRAMDTLVCWGRNNNNQIVPGAASVLEPQPTAVSWPQGPAGLGLEHSCVGEPGGPGLQCMGGNANSELGGSGSQPVESALPVALPIDELAMGDDHGCARAGGRVWCWGSDQYGQLGQNAVAGPTPAKTEVSLPSDAVALVAGSDHTCVALDDGMAVRCWGRNTNGQIGDGTTSNRQLPAALADPLPAAVVAMDSSVDTTCALLASGELWCWGGLNASDLGIDIDTNTPLTAPQRVPATDALPEPVTRFGVGSRHLCAAASTGRLWCWGRNSSWQVGPTDELLVSAPFELDLGCPPG